MDTSDDNELLNLTRILKFLDHGLKKIREIFPKRWSYYRRLNCPGEKYEWEDGEECGKFICELCASFVKPGFEGSLKIGEIKKWDITLTKFAIQGVSKAIRDENKNLHTDSKEETFINELNRIKNEILHGGDFKLTDDEYSFYCAQLTDIFIKFGYKRNDIEAFKENFMKFGQSKIITDVKKKSMPVNDVVVDVKIPPSNINSRTFGLNDSENPSSSFFIKKIDEKKVLPLAGDQAANNQGSVMLNSQHNHVHRSYNATDVTDIRPKKFHIPQRPPQILMQAQPNTRPIIPSKDGKLKYYQKNNQNTKQQINKEPPQFFLQHTEEQKLVAWLANKKNFNDELKKYMLDKSASKYGESKKHEKQYESQLNFHVKEEQAAILANGGYVSATKNLFEKLPK